MQQQQPGTVTHSCISFLLIARCLSRYCLGLELLRDIQFALQLYVFIRAESGRGNLKIFAHTLRARTPLSKFLNPPLHIYIFVATFRYVRAHI